MKLKDINHFDPDKVTYTTDIDAILKFHKAGRLIDFLPRIHPTRTFKATNTFRWGTYTIRQHQQDILATWVTWFESEGTPVALTSGIDYRGEYLVLWKERRT